MLHPEKEHNDALSEEEHSQCRSSISTLPIDYLSPVSRTKHVHNMRSTISQLQRKLRCINPATVVRDEHTFI